MGKNGYWIECVPIQRRANQNTEPDLYSASTVSFPDLHTYGRTPDAAIEKLRDKLKILKKRYVLEHRVLPQPHHPLSPTARYTGVDGWMSIYMDLEDSTKTWRSNNEGLSS